MSLLKSPVAYLNADRRRWVLLTFAGVVVTSVLASKLEGRGQKQRGSGKAKARVNGTFFRQISRMLRIAIPGWTSSEAMILYFLSAMLISRTLLSIVIAEIAGTNAQYLVATQWTQLMEGVKKFGLATIPAAVVNSSLKWSTSMLALRIRYRLCKAVNKCYLTSTNFYKATQYPSFKIDHADQRLTADISNFSESIADLYANVAKPLLDVIIYTYALAAKLGWQAPLVMYIYFGISSAVKKRIMPGFGRMVARESELEGYYRTAHQRIIANSEEVAFYDGAERERGIIEKALRDIYDQQQYVANLRLAMNCFDQLLVKYWASIAGYMVVASPFLLDLPSARKSTEEHTRDYILNTQYLTNMSNAVGNLVLAGNKLTTIAGHTLRVTELLDLVGTLDRVGHEPFQVKEDGEDALGGAKGTAAEFSSTLERLKGWLQEWAKRCDAMADTRAARYANTAPQRAAMRTKASKDGGTIEIADHIEFHNVDLVNPDGVKLASNLNFKVPRGTNVMVTGPNGCGKSSLFRVIGELWPLASGRLLKPIPHEVLFVPQRPYLVLGTLRDQIIYPHSQADMRALGVTDADLENLLTVVDPDRRVRASWEWNDVCNWTSAFSGGQKQRVAMARLFYHRPMYAILDECTSAVSADVEDAIYHTCKELGITIFTVSHRPGLKRHHDHVLAFDGYGNWSWTDVKESEKAKRT